MTSYFEEHNISTEAEKPGTSELKHRFTIQDFLGPDVSVPDNEFTQLANQYLKIIQDNADASELDQLVLLDNLVEELVQQAQQQDNKGAPPASKRFIESLTIVSQDKIEKNARCSICKEDLDREEAKDRVTRLPCKHYFEKECVVPWLKLHNTCPVCRAEVPSDDKAWKDKQAALVPYEDFDPDYMYS